LAKADQADAAVKMDQWISSSGLRQPE
jgi:hypothetical protein